MAPLDHGGLAIREKADAAVEATKPRPGAEIEYGKPMRELFLFSPGFRNLNHGSFGTIPRAIQAKLRSYQDLAEAQPDPFIRYDYPRLLDESRAAVAALLHAPVDTVVFVANATTGVNTVLRNTAWAADCLDEIIHFDTIYGGCGKTVDYLVDRCGGRVAARVVDLEYPCEDDEVVRRFEEAVATARVEGKRPRVCVFDVVSSSPGVRFPYEAVTRSCRELGILSCVDGAQGIGMVDLDLGALDPDFFVSNCHKWLHVPRGCAVFYVPLRNQGLIKSTLPTSHGYVSEKGTRFNPLPPSSKSVFVNNFEFVGTIDDSPYLCVKDSIRWREEVLGGEEKILAYLWKLAKEGGKKVAEILGTEVMDNSTGTLTDCAMVNVALPLWVNRDADEKEKAEAETNGEPKTTATIPAEDANVATNWVLRTFMSDYNTFIVVYLYRGRWWTRLSAQVYLDMEDFEWAGKTLKEVCERAANGEYLAG